MGLHWEAASTVPDGAVQQLLASQLAAQLMGSKLQPAQWSAQGLTTIPESVESPSHQALSPTSYDSQPESPGLMSPATDASPTSALATNSDSEDAGIGVLDGQSTYMTELCALYSAYQQQVQQNRALAVKEAETRQQLEQFMFLLNLSQQQAGQYRGEQASRAASKPNTLNSGRDRMQPKVVRGQVVFNARQRRTLKRAFERLTAVHLLQSGRHTLSHEEHVSLCELLVQLYLRRMRNLASFQTTDLAFRVMDEIRKPCCPPQRGPGGFPAQPAIPRSAPPPAGLSAAQLANLAAEGRLQGSFPVLISGAAHPGQVPAQNVSMGVPAMHTLPTVQTIPRHTDYPEFAEYSFPRVVQNPQLVATPATQGVPGGIQTTPYLAPHTGPAAAHLPQPSNLHALRLLSNCHVRSFSEDSVASGRGSIHTENFASPRVADTSALPRLPTSLPSYLGGVAEHVISDTLPLDSDRLRSMHSIYNDLVDDMGALSVEGVKVAHADVARGVMQMQMQVQGQQIPHGHLALRPEGSVGAPGGEQWWWQQGAASKGGLFGQW